MTESTVTPKVGMKATVCGWSDREVYDIIAVTASGKTLTLRRREPILVKPPVMVPGGFAGVVKEPAVWKTEENLDGRVIKARWSNKFKEFRTYDKSVMIDVDSYFYDYEF